MCAINWATKCANKFYGKTENQLSGMGNVAEIEELLFICKRINQSYLYFFLNI